MRTVGQETCDWRGASIGRDFDASADSALEATDLLSFGSKRPLDEGSAHMMELPCCGCGEPILLFQNLAIYLVRDTCRHSGRIVDGR